MVVKKLRLNCGRRAPEATERVKHSLHFPGLAGGFLHRHAAFFDPLRVCAAPHPQFPFDAGDLACERHHIANEASAARVLGYIPSALADLMRRVDHLNQQVVAVAAKLEGLAP